MTGLTRHEVVLEDVLDVARVAGRDEPARKVRARDEPFAGHVAQRAFVGAGDAGGGQRIAHPLRARRAALADLGQAAVERGVIGIDPQPDHVDRLVLPAHRQLGAADELDPGRRRRVLGLRQSRDLVVVGQRQDVDAARGGALHEGCGREKPVGTGRMAVEIVTAHRAGIALTH